MTTTWCNEFRSILLRTSLTHRKRGLPFVRDALCWRIDALADYLEQRDAKIAEHDEGIRRLLEELEPAGPPRADVPNGSGFPHVLLSSLSQVLAPSLDRHPLAPLCSTVEKLICTDPAVLREASNALGCWRDESVESIEGLRDALYRCTEFYPDATDRDITCEPLQWRKVPPKTANGATQVLTQQQTDQLWHEVVRPMGNPNAQALLSRSEFKIDVFKALKAIGAMVKSAKGATNPITLGPAMFDAVLALWLLKEAVFLKRTEAEFLVCVVASTQTEGKTLEEIAADVDFYHGLSDDELKLLPSYLRVDRALLNKAKNNLDEPDGLKNTVAKLIERGSLLHDAGKYRYNTSLVTVNLS